MVAVVAMMTAMPVAFMLSYSSSTSTCGIDKQVSTDSHYSTSVKSL